MFQPEECYPMKNSHRGSALIFVNVKREGAKIEIEHLKFIAELMGLEPFVYLDLTSTQVTNILESITNPGKNVDLSNIQPTPPKLCKDDDIIFIAFSTHGFEEGLRFSDRKDLKYSCLKNFFNIDNCPVLIGKPKIIFFNSCRCTNVDEIFDKSFLTRKPPHTLIMTDGIGKDTTDTTNSDIIVIHSTNLGTVSIRLEDRGSLAIEQIKVAFEKYSGTGLTYERILSRANRELIRTTYTETKEHADENKIHRIGQCMDWVSTLKYDLIIPPVDSQLAIELDNYNKGTNKEVIDLTVESVFEDLNITTASSNLYSKSPPVTYSNSASNDNEKTTAKFISKSTAKIMRKSTAKFISKSTVGNRVGSSSNTKIHQWQNSPSSRSKLYNYEILETPRSRVSNTSNNITSKYVRENIIANSSTSNHLQQWFPNGTQAISQANSMTLNHSPCATYNHQLKLGRSLFASSPQVKHKDKVRLTEKIKIDNFRNSNKKRKLNYSASEQDGMLKKKQNY